MASDLAIKMDLALNEILNGLRSLGGFGYNDIMATDGLGFGYNDGFGS